MLSHHPVPPGVLLARLLLEWRFCVSLSEGSQRLFVFALHFCFYLHSQIQLSSSCCWLRSSALDLVSLQNKFLVLSFESGSSCSALAQLDLKITFSLIKTSPSMGEGFVLFSPDVICKHLEGLCPIDPCMLHILSL